ncbi:hypothetical protein Hanom_Chr08g00727191 [Helianthus anomalus]
MVSTVLMANVGILLIWPNHLNLPSLILFDILATPNLSLKTLFLILSNLVCPHIHHILPAHARLCLLDSPTLIS